MSIRPTGYLSQVLSSQEEVLLITRPHWFVLIGKTILWIILFVGLVSVAAFMAATNSPDWFWWLIGALVPLGFWFWEYLVWSNRMNVMTDRRVIQMDGVFNKRVSDSMLEKLNDVKTEQSFLGRMFGYGDIELLTASEQGVNVLRMINDPLGFKREMLNAKEQMHDENGRAAD